MKDLSWKLAAAWIGAQAVFLVAWAWREETRRHRGEPILVRIVPVDPRDLLRGQYMTLGYEFSRPSSIPGADALEDGAPVWVELTRAGEFHVPAAMHAAPPASWPRGDVVLRGRKERWRIVYGIEKYFVPEGTPTPDAQHLTARLRVERDGSVRIEQVLLHGRPWP